MSYRYSRTNMLNNPEHYFYTKFEGEEFIEAWFENRAMYVAKYNGVYDLSRLHVYVASIGVLTSTTESILRDLSYLESATECQVNIIDRLKNWIKIFENTKTIGDKNNDILLTKNNKRAGNIINYILLAYFFEASYRRFESLICLNSLLKLMDIIVAQPSSHAHCELVADLSQREKTHVCKLYVEPQT